MSKNRTYEIQGRKGITDLSSFTNDFGDWFGVEGICTDEQQYFQDTSKYNALLEQKNNAYIEQLKKDGEYGKEFTTKVTLQHSPLFDGMFTPKKTLESYRMVFLNKNSHIIYGSPGEMPPEEQKKILGYFNIDNMTTEEQIKHVKQLRVDIDKNIQETKSFLEIKKEKGQAEITLALRKLQEAKMWLGQTLAEMGDTTPYPESHNPNSIAIEPTAESYKLGEAFISVHFTIKDQSIESIAQKIEQNYSKIVAFIGNRKPVFLHTFLPKETVIEKGFSTDVYDKILDKYFPGSTCFYKSDLEAARAEVADTINQFKGAALFIGDIKEGVALERDILWTRKNVTIFYFNNN